MNDTPEKLWVDPTGVDDLDMYIAHASDTMDYLNMDIPYIRKDISDSRIEKLEQALRFYVANHLIPDEGPWGINSTDFGEVARAALTGEP
jgi:hypothetical protein